MNPAALKDYLRNCRLQVKDTNPFRTAGRLTRINGLVMEASGLRLPLGAGCRIESPGTPSVEAEVVGFNGERLFMMPTEDVYGLAPGAHVFPIEPAITPPRPGVPVPAQRRIQDRAKHLPVGDCLLGRVLDGNGRPLDDLGPLVSSESRSLASRPLNPLQREPIRHSMDVGIRAINALLTVGRGQRLGLFSGSGVGKSVLLGMMARAEPRS
jgi:flagellum-specific ATP synthase